MPAWDSARGFPLALSVGDFITKQFNHEYHEAFAWGIIAPIPARFFHAV